MARYRCPDCGHDKSWKFISKHYGMYARKCKWCGNTNTGADWAEAGRAEISQCGIMKHVKTKSLTKGGT